MIEKFSTIYDLDLSRLYQKLIDFSKKSGYDPYIFANHDTLQDIRVHAGYAGSIKEIGNTEVVVMDDIWIARYQRYKMFEDNTLKYGEIELR